MRTSRIGGMVVVVGFKSLSSSMGVEWRVKHFRIVRSVCSVSARKESSVEPFGRRELVGEGW